MQCIGWLLGEVDLFEVNEVFVVVGMVVMCDFDLFYECFNVYGGVCVLGYLIGVFGVWIVVILFNVLQQYDLECGVVVVCIGGGEVIVIVVECLC